MSNNDNKAFEQLREAVSKQVQDAYKEGARQGAIGTAAILYNIMESIGLETDNILFDILRDIAKRNGCEDLPQRVKEMKEKQQNDSSQMLS